MKDIGKYLNGRPVRWSARKMRSPVLQHACLLSFKRSMTACWGPFQVRRLNLQTCRCKLKVTKTVELHIAWTTCYLIRLLIWIFLENTPHVWQAVETSLPEKRGTMIRMESNNVLVRGSNFKKDIHDTLYRRNVNKMIREHVKIRESGEAMFRLDCRYPS